MKNSQNVIYNRRKKILDILQQTKKISIKKLADKLKVSEITIRRDEKSLEDMGELFLNKGIIVLSEKDGEIDPFTERSKRINLAIAKTASKLVEDNSKVFVNSSRLALLTVSQMYKKQITFLSNNIRLSSIPHNNKSVLLLSGGEIREPKEILVGDYASSFFRNIIVDYSVIGIAGISPINGLTTPIYQESIINRIMIENTRKKVIIVGDFSRIGKISNFKTADLKKIGCLVTDQYANPTLIKEIRKIGIEVVQAII